MTLVTCMISACVNWTRDGKNCENEIMRNDGKKMANDPIFVYIIMHITNKIHRCV